MHVTPFRDSPPIHGRVENGEADRPLRLLLVDDDPEMLRALSFYFERRGFLVVPTDTLVAAKLRFASCSGWMLIIADYHLPDGNGWDLFCWIRQQAANVPFLLISGSQHPATMATQVDFLAKPFSIDELERCVNKLLAIARQ